MFAVRSCFVARVVLFLVRQGRSPRVTAHATVPAFGMSPSHSAEALSNGRIVPVPPSQLTSILSNTGLSSSSDDKTLEIAKLLKQVQVGYTHQ
jgi:hypothetical protein